MPAVVFVTVGTTMFDELLAQVDTAEVQGNLHRLFGDLELRIQRGKSKLKPTSVYIPYF